MDDCYQDLTLFLSINTILLSGFTSIWVWGCKCTILSYEYCLPPIYINQHNIVIIFTQIYINQHNIVIVFTQFISINTILLSYFRKSTDFRAEEDEAVVLQKCRQDLVKIASDLLNVDVAEIDVDEEMTGSGFDIFKLTEFARVVNEAYSLEIRSGIFSEYPSLSLFSQYVCKEYEDVLVGYYLDNNEEITESNGKGQLSLEDIAYTLQVGREEMEERLAVVVSSIQELIEKLTDYSQGETDIEQLYRGNVKNGKTQFESIFKGEEGGEYLGSLVDNRRVAKLAEYWVFGTSIDWELLYQSIIPTRVSLPTYPFARDRYWIPKSDKIIRDLDGIKGQITKLHPFIDRNMSTLQEQKFSTQFSGNEFYLSDHVVMKQKVLPGVAYIEMARAAGELAGERKVEKVQNIVWVHPIVVKENPQEVYISLYPERDFVEYEVSTRGEDTQKVVHGQGKIVYERNEVIQSRSGEGVQTKRKDIDIKSIKERCKNKRSREEYYDMFQSTGLQYGPSFQVIQELCFNENEAFSCLVLPENFIGTLREFELHPSIMDGALQTTMALTNSSDSLYLPFTLGEVEIHGRLSERCYAYVKQSGDRERINTRVKKFNIHLLDDAGQILVKIVDLFVRAIHSTKEVHKIEYKKHNENTENRNMAIIDLLTKLENGELKVSQVDNLIDRL